MNALALTISNIAIRQDTTGRYCLNDLHKASGSEEKHSPNRWTRTEGYQNLIAELSTPKMAFIPCVSVRGRGIQGTYAIKELVYAYAMWISAKFHIQVIRAYDALVTTSMSGAAISLQDIETLIDAKLKAQRPVLEPIPQSHADSNPLTYRLRAQQPGEIRWISDIAIEQLNDQLSKQGYRIVRI